MRAAVEEAGKKLGLDGSYIPHSYIEQVQLEEMTEELRHMTMEMKDKFVMAANRGYDVPGIERSNSGVALGSITMGSAGRGRKEARSESVTRLQDAVRKKRKDSRGERGAGSDSGWGSNGGEFDLLNPGGNSINVNGGAAAMGMSSPPPRPPSRPHSRTGRPPHHGHGSHPGGGAGGRTHSVAAVAGDNSGSGSGSGGDEGPDPKFFGGFGGYNTVASPYHPGQQGGYASPVSVALEGRLNMLSQRVDDLAQAHMRQVTAAAATAGGRGSSVGADTVVQTQMLLSAKIDAMTAASVAKSSGEGRMQLLLAAAGGAAAAVLAIRLADLFSSSSSSGR